MKFSMINYISFNILSCKQSVYLYIHVYWPMWAMEIRMSIIYQPSEYDYVLLCAIYYCAGRHEYLI